MVIILSYVVQHAELFKSDLTIGRFIDFVHQVAACRTVYYYAVRPPDHHCASEDTYRKQTSFHHPEALARLTW